MEVNAEKRSGVPALPKWKAGVASLSKIDSRAWLNMSSAKTMDIMRSLWGPWMAEPRVEGGRVLSLTGSAEDGSCSRRARLFKPTGVKPGAPLIVMLHGCLQDAESFARLTKMDEKARAEGFCVLYANQDASAHPLRGWNWNSAKHQARGCGEPAALASLVTKAQHLCGATPRLTALAGISAGGAMAASFAHLYPEMIGSVALVASPVPFGDKSVECALDEMSKGPGIEVDDQCAKWAHEAGERQAGRSRRMPMLIVQGMSDMAVHPDHALALERSALMLNASLGPKSQAEANVMAMSQAEAPGGLCRLWRDGYGRAVASFVAANGLSHAWSGGSPSEPFSQAGFDQSQLLVDFFKAARGGLWDGFEPDVLAKSLWQDQAVPKVLLGRSAVAMKR